MKFEKIEKLLANLHDNTEYFIHIRHSKPALNHGLVLQKFIYNVDMKTDLRKKAKNDLENDFFKLINKVVFGKTMENEKKN